MPGDGSFQPLKEIVMLKKFAALLAAVALLTGLAACNTVKGVGKDVEAAGEGVQNAADKARR